MHAEKLDEKRLSTEMSTSGYNVILLDMYCINELKIIKLSTVPADL